MAKWVEFVCDRDHRPHVNQVIAYKASAREYLPDAIADEMISKGFAKEIDKPDDLKSDKDGRAKPIHPAPKTGASKEA